MLAFASLWCRFYSLLLLSSTKCSHRLHRSHPAWKKMKSCMCITSSRQAVNTGSGGAIEVSIYETYFASAGKTPLNSNCLGRRAPQKGSGADRRDSSGVGRARSSSIGYKDVAAQTWFSRKQANSHSHNQLHGDFKSQKS